MKSSVIFIVMLCIMFSAYSQNPKTVNPKKIPNWIKGTWSLVSVENIYPNGDKVYPYGDQPKGLLIFDANGNYSLQIVKAVRILVASGDKNRCTAEENAALVQGSNAHFGKYTIDEAAQAITFNIEYASFPNWNFNKQRRSYTCTNQKLKYVVASTTQGGGSVSAEVIWERVPGS